MSSSAASKFDFWISRLHVLYAILPVPKSDRMFDAPAGGISETCFFRSRELDAFKPPY